MALIYPCFPEEQTHWRYGIKPLVGIKLTGGFLFSQQICKSFLSTTKPLKSELLTNGHQKI